LQKSNSGVNKNNTLQTLVNIVLWSHN